MPVMTTCAVAHLRVYFFTACLHFRYSVSSIRARTYQFCLRTNWHKGKHVCVCARVLAHACESACARSVVSNSLQTPGLSKLLCLRNFPGKNTGVGCHFLLQGYPRPRDQTHISCISCTDRQILYPCTTWEAWHKGKHVCIFKNMCANHRKE